MSESKDSNQTKAAGTAPDKGEPKVVTSDTKVVTSESKLVTSDTEVVTSDTVEILIDGEPRQVAKGQNLLEALLEVGEDVSYFCYHPKLSIVAKCRQCLVGLGDAHKLVPACQLTTKEGMKVRSKTEQVLEARRAQLEFTLLNHPIDCVICDKAGECALQRMYMDWDGEASLVNHEKVHKPKKVDIGPEIVLDAERCIMCDRCVRFCSEVAKRPQLVFAQRGDHTVLSTAPGEKLDNPYALNTVDICPVGALTDRDFRFKSRVWELWATTTVCTGCAAGCGMEIHHKGGEILRQVPPKRWDMNENWMCNFGRRTYKSSAERERLTAPRVGDGEASAEQAIATIVDGLGPYLGSEEQAAKVAIVLAADATNEDNCVAAYLAREVLGGAKLFLAEKPDDGQGDDILRRHDPNANRAGARAIGGGGLGDGELGDGEALAKGLEAGDFKVLYVLGDALELPAGVLRKLKKTADLVVQQARHESGLSKRATVILPAAAFAEVDGTITNFEGETKRLRPAFEPPGHARPHWAWLQQVCAALGKPWEVEAAEAVFGRLRAQVPAFADASWGENMRTRRLRFGDRRG